jgi:peptide chain release factor subunit 1
MILYENLEVKRFTLKNSSTEEEVIKILDKKGEADPSNFLDSDSGATLEIVESILLIEWVFLFSNL